MTEFFLKSQPGRGDTVRVIEWIENDSGFVGRASDQDRASVPILYAKFRNALDNFGEDKALEVARKEGEWRMPKEPRRKGAIERDLQKAEERLLSLHEEMKNAVAREKVNEAALKQKKKAKKGEA